MPNPRIVMCGFDTLWRRPPGADYFTVQDLGVDAG